MKSAFKYILTCICFLGILPLKAQYTTGDFNSSILISEGINAPGRMAVDTDDNIFVIDAVQKSILKYNSQGNHTASNTTDINPSSIAINKNNQLLTGDMGTGTRITSIKINKECII
jgi:PKD repeat protein